MALLQHPRHNMYPSTLFAFHSLFNSSIFRQLAVQSPEIFSELGQDELFESWHDKGLGARMKWLRPITDAKQKTIQTILHAIR